MGLSFDVDHQAAVGSLIRFVFITGFYDMTNGHVVGRNVAVRRIGQGAQERRGYSEIPQLELGGDDGNSIQAPLGLLQLLGITQLGDDLNRSHKPMLVGILQLVVREYQLLPKSPVLFVPII